MSALLSQSAAVASPVAVVRSDRMWNMSWPDAVLGHDNVAGTPLRFVHVRPHDTADLPRIIKLLAKRRRCRFVITIRDLSDLTPSGNRKDKGYEVLELLELGLDTFTIPSHCLVVVSSVDIDPQPFEACK